MKNLSKSQYTRGLQCEKSLWLYRERKDLQDPVSPQDQAIFDQGTEVGILAHKWIKGGILIEADHAHPQDALDATAAAIAAGAEVIYEAAFLYDGVLIRADIMVRNPKVDGKAWDLYEVKSTTKVEDEHLLDVAIQRYVLNGAGIGIARAFLAHIDSSYVRRGALDLDELFEAEDITAESEDALGLVPSELARLKAAAALKEAPKVAIGPHCTKPHGCSFQGHCWKEVPDYSVFNLAGARKDKTTRLWNSGVKTIAEIPKEEKLTAYQDTQRFVAKTGKPVILAEGIRELLANLVYPHYFLDFEAVNPAIPPYDGTRPYQAIPFEASLHVRKERGAPLEHYEFLADGTADPRRELVDFLLQYLVQVPIKEANGSVIAYHKSYEGGILNALADFSGGSAPHLFNIASRLWDLADPFKKALYAHPAFEGSWSIKKVLPALIPDMKYDGMAIADGVAAMRAYTRLMTEPLTPAQRAQIMADLKAYCGQDTLAMVRILDRIEADLAVAA